MSGPFAHPLSGEIIPDELAALKGALEQTDLFLSRVYPRLREIRERIAELEPIVLPPRRWQSEVQAKVHRCPRCGGRHAA